MKYQTNPASSLAGAHIFPSYPHISTDRSTIPRRFSLPTTVDHTELSARLKEHLSAYAEVNFVRIIRDSRGGVCAFVQCNVKVLILNRISPHPSVRTLRLPHNLYIQFAHFPLKALWVGTCASNPLALKGRSGSRTGALFFFFAGLKYSFLNRR